MAFEIPAPISNSLKLPKGGGTEYVLNNHAYEIELWISNSVTNPTPYVISPTGIISLIIEDGLDNWVTNGHVIIRNNNELMELLNNFSLTNDGNDILRLRLIPKDFPTKGLPSLNINQNKKMWELNYLFTISEVEDVTPQTPSNTQANILEKFKKIYFHDRRYTILSSAVIGYSTGTSAYAPIQSLSLDDPNSLRDENRSVNTGKAMFEILTKFFGESAIDIKSWDDGLTKILYTSPATSTAYDDLMYLYTRHVGPNDDYCILSIEPEADTAGRFVLRPLTEYFAKAGKSSPGEFQIEHFFLEADQIREPGSQSVIPYRAPYTVSNDMSRDIKIKDYNIITKYEFADIIPDVNVKQYTNIPVYSFDFRNRTFNCEFTKSTIESANEHFTTNYVSNLFTRHGASSFLLNTEDPFKSLKLNTRPVFSLYGDSETSSLRIPDGFHRLLYNGLFQNTCINFTVPGLPIRESGRFIAIDRQSGSPANQFDDKACGQWFVINVIHNIVNGVYTNNITAIKIHRYQEIQNDAAPLIDFNTKSAIAQNIA